MDELWDLYDSHKNPIGKTHKRGEPIAAGEFHLVVEILLTNKQGQALITQRHPDKTHAGKWEWSGGSVVAGESSLDGAMRELAEETGITVTKDQIVFKGSVISLKQRSIYDCYHAQRDFCGGDIVLQDGETVDYNIVTLDAIADMVARGQFIDQQYHRQYAAWGEALDFSATLL